MTGLGGGGGFWANKSVEQALATNARERARAAGSRRAAPMPGFRGRARNSVLLRRMGLGSALWTVTGPAAPGEAARHADAEMRPGILPVDDLHGAAMCGDELQHD